LRITATKLVERKQVHVFRQRGCRGQPTAGVGPGEYSTLCTLRMLTALTFSVTRLYFGLAKPPALGTLTVEVVSCEDIVGADDNGLRCRTNPNYGAVARPAYSLWFGWAWW
jgi:hypothetical protein